MTIDQLTRFVLVSAPLVAAMEKCADAIHDYIDCQDEAQTQILRLALQAVEDSLKTCRAVLP